VRQSRRWPEARAHLTGRSASGKSPQIGEETLTQIHPVGRLATSTGHVLGRKLDSIPFSPYHMMLIAVLALVGFVDGYDLVMTGSLLVLAKQPLHLGPSEIRFLAIAPTMMICLGGFIASAISDHYSRKTIMLIGVAGLTLFTLLLTLVRTGEQLIILRLLTGLAGGFAVFAPFPIAAELMPARHRRTFIAVYEMALACSFAVLPLVGGLLADSPNAFRLMALPGLAFFVMPALIYFLIPESPRWYLRRGLAEAAVDTVNRIIRGAGSRVPPRALATLGDNMQVAREELPPYRALFYRGQLRWTAIGISSYVFAGTAFFLISVLLPKALVDQGGAVTLSFGVTSLVFRRKHTGKGLHRLLDGDHRATVDDLLCPRRLAARSFPDDDGVPRRTLRDGSAGHGRADDRLYRAVGGDCLPDLPLRAVPDGAARARTCLWRVRPGGSFRGCWRPS
jgi:MFS family permease